ncbi:MAG: DEAD/DEAH box helicase [Thermoplasmatota archaeon]
MHPALQALLEEEGWSGLTDIQQAAFATDARHVLLMAPTGHGKTEAALLPVLDRLLRERDAVKGWPAGFKVLYITPLRALNRDLRERLEGWCERLGFSMGVRHGDTTQYERGKQSRNPPDILVTTPETLQLLLYGDKLRAGLSTVRFVVVDEVHDLAASERGSQLTLALERLEEAIAAPGGSAKERHSPDAPAPMRSGFRRIGLSATVADPAAVCAFLGGPRPVEEVTVEAKRVSELRVSHPPAGEEESGEWSLPPAAVGQLLATKRIVEANKRVLVFQNTRDGAELMASRANLAGLQVGLHHGSLDAEHRRQVESDFKQGKLHALVCTSSLELGIDVGAIDHVVQVQSPRSVARMLQRLGRAGHRIGLTSRGTLLANGAEDALECLAIATLARDGTLEPLQIRDAPLIVLAQQLIAMENEYASMHRDWAYSIVRRAGPYMDLDEGVFRVVWDALIDHGQFEENGRLLRSGRARNHFLGNVSMIPDERTFRVMDEVTKRGVGSVDESFTAVLEPGALFVMAGRSWQVLEVDAEQEKIRVAPAKEMGNVPDWAGSMLPVSATVAQAAVELRMAVLRRELWLEEYADADALETARRPLMDQVEQGLAVPTNDLVTIESSRRHVTCNVALGTKGNEALGRVTQALLHQRVGKPVGMQCDAYRIHFTLPTEMGAADIEETWLSLQADGLEELLTWLLQDSPLVKHHLLQVARHFGAIPPKMDPNRFGRKRMESLLQDPALSEETLNRLLHDRLDVPAVATWLRALHGGRVRIIRQGHGPISRLGDDRIHRTLAPKPTEALLAAVRERLEKADVMLVCTQCRHRKDAQLLLVDAIRCRRCGSNQVACLRPWHEEQIRFLGKGALTAEERKQRTRILRNAQLVAAWGKTACYCLVARGVGPDTTARILQKSSTPSDSVFWREILEAELQFARTSAFWKD